MPLDNAEYLPPSVQILLGADRLLAGPGNWLRGRLDDGKGGFCILGALMASVHNSAYDCNSAPYFAAFRRVEDLAIARGYHMQSTFNNAPETTFSDIKALLQEAIELESAKVAA